VGREVLVEHVLLVDGLHDVGPDDCVQVGLHEVEHQVDVLVVLGLEDVEEGDDVGVAVEFLQEDDLSRGRSTSR
jgi:hypothetical protein